MMNNFRDFDQYDVDRDAARMRDEQHPPVLIACECEHEHGVEPYDLGYGDEAYEFNDEMRDDARRCYDCARENPARAQRDEMGFAYIERRVVKLGAVVNRADPTQTYVLDCGHIAID